MIGRHVSKSEAAEKQHQHEGTEDHYAAAPHEITGQTSAAGAFIDEPETEPECKRKPNGFHR
jgi:hypothetical protein